jgi:hypothetical protein
VLCCCTIGGCIGWWDRLLYRPAVNVCGETETCGIGLGRSVHRTESRVAERVVIGLTAWLTKVMIRGCRGSDTEIFILLFDN